MRTPLAVVSCVALASLGVPVLVSAPADATVVNTADVTATIHCGPGNRTVTVNGSEAHLTLTGHCTSLVVNGSEARITAATVDKISVSGSEGRVTYKRASSGGAARVSVTGSESSVRRR